MYRNFFIHSSVDGHIGGFHVPVIVNSAAVNIGVHVFFSVPISSRYVPSSGIVKSYGSFIPSFLRNLHIVLHSDYINLHSHQQCKRVLSVFIPEKYSRNHVIILCEFHKWILDAKIDNQRSYILNIWIHYLVDPASTKIPVKFSSPLKRKK